MAQQQFPSEKDESFKAFLEKVTTQNKLNLALQALQTKYEREISGEDDDKREEQLDQVNENLDGVKEEASSIRDGLFDLSDDITEVQDQLDGVQATLDKIDESALHLDKLETIDPVLTKIHQTLVGLDEHLESSFENSHLVAVISAIGANTNKLLDEQLKELSLVRKLTEGSVEYSKEAAQYRNTSGRDVQSLVSGKTSKTGGFIDFETARDTLTGQGERARQNNKLNLITSVTTTRARPGNTTAGALGADVSEAPPEKMNVGEPGADEPTKRARRERIRGKGAEVTPKEDKEEITSFGGVGDLFKAVKSRVSGIGDFLTGKVEKKENEPNPGVVGKNPESDNIQDSQEIAADAAKDDLQLTKETNEIQKQQLAELIQIKNALIPKTPGTGDTGNTPAAKPNPVEPAAESGPGLGDALSLLPDIGKAGKGAAGKAAGAASKFGKIAKIGGAALAIGAGAYTAYQGWTGAEESKQAKLEEVQAKVDSGEMSTEQAAAARKEIGNTATVEKAGAAGEGTGMAVGGIAGMKAGAAIGTMIGGPVGTAVGAVAGGALGAFAGSSAGKWVGEKAGQGINYVKDSEVGKKVGDLYTGAKEGVSNIGGKVAGFFGFGDKKAKQVAPATSNTTNTTTNITNSTATPAPGKVSTTGPVVANTSTENADIARETSATKPTVTPIVSNNVSSSNNTSYVPLKPQPRPEHNGSALEKYQGRISVY